MNAKGVIRDVGRALDMPYKEVDTIAKLVPADLENDHRSGHSAGAPPEGLIDTDEQMTKAYHHFKSP